MTLTTRDAFVDVQHPPALPGGRVIHLRKPLQDANLKLLRERRDMRKRCGFSLLEILLALAILGGSLALLSRIVETGTSAAREARDLSVARILCQTKLSELLLDSMTGISPQSVPLGPLESFDSQSTHTLLLQRRSATGSAGRAACDPRGCRSSEIPTVVRRWHATH